MSDDAPKVKKWMVLGDSFGCRGINEMGKETGISWTDHSYNPWWGCTKVSPGCDHCYAESFDKRIGGAHWGNGVPRREFGDKHWNEPMKWNEDARKAGKRALVFCASMADVMDDEAPAGARERLWKLIDATPNLIWQLLTKRPQRYEQYLPDCFVHDNVWLGTTAENQECYDLRWPILRVVKARTGRQVKWISYEPALGPIDLMRHAAIPDWIIFGGESGHGRRECQEEWADAICAQCLISGTHFFMKQMSAPTAPDGKKLIPARLNIQQIPWR